MHIVNILVNNFTKDFKLIETVVHPVFEGTLGECRMFCQKLENSIQENDSIHIGEFRCTVVSKDCTNPFGIFNIGNNYYLDYNISKLESLKIGRIQEI